MNASSAQLIATWGAVCLTLVQAWITVRQTRQIWVHQSGQAMPTGSMLYIVAMFTAGTIYGFSSKQWPVIFNSLILGTCYVPLVASLVKYRGWTWLEGALTVGLLIALSLMLASNHREQWFLAFSAGGFISFAFVTAEIWTGRCVGVVKLELLIIGLTSNIFWLTYALATHERNILITSGSFTALFVLTIGLWWKYRPISETNSTIINGSA